MAGQAGVLYLHQNALELQNANFINNTGLNIVIRNSKINAQNVYIDNPLPEDSISKEELAENEVFMSFTFLKINKCHIKLTSSKLKTSIRYIILVELLMNLKNDAKFYL